MKTTWTIAAAIGLASLSGCGDAAPEKMKDTVDVTATVTGPDGKPLAKDFAVVLQPTGNGFPAELSPGPDGKFTGKVIPGPYVYSVCAIKNDKLLARIPEKYHSPSQDHKVEVRSGEPLTITLN